MFGDDDRMLNCKYELRFFPRLANRMVCPYFHVMVS